MKTRCRDSIKRKKMKVLKAKDVPKLRRKWQKEQLGKDAALDKYDIQNPTLDHDHTTGYCRGVLDREVNQFLGKVESAYKRFLRYKGIQLPGALRGLANYLEDNRSPEEILHPKSVSLAIRKFSRLTEGQQISKLIPSGLPPSTFLDKSKRERTKLYRKFLTRKSNIYDNF